MTTLENDVRTRTAANHETVEYRKVWDLPIRLFHWILVGAFVGAFVTNRLGVSYFKYHVWCGYAVIVLVAFRVIWGLVGTRHAKFAHFIKGPLEILRYARDLSRGHASRFAGHNPLGALMVVALLLALGAQASFGLFSNDEIFNVGPLYGYVGKDLGLQLTSLHRKLFYWIAMAVAVHIAAVIFYAIVKREALIRAMITGGKPSHVVGPGDTIASSRSLRALLILVAISGAFALLLHFAPASELDIAGF